jgi:hypothetical protein
MVEQVVGGLGPDERVAALVPTVDERTDRSDRSLTLPKLARRMACRVMIEKNTSTVRLVQARVVHHAVRPLVDPQDAGERMRLYLQQR